MRNRLFVIASLLILIQLTPQSYAADASCMKAYANANSQYDEDLRGTFGKQVAAFLIEVGCIAGSIKGGAGVFVPCTAVAGAFAGEVAYRTHSLPGEIASLKPKRDVFVIYSDVENNNLAELKDVYKKFNLKTEVQQAAFNEHVVDGINSGKFCENGKPKVTFEEALSVSGEEPLTN